MSQLVQDKCPHDGGYYIRLNLETSCYDFQKDEPITVYCDKCNKPLTATVKVQLPPKCMIGGEHTVKDCPLKLPLDAHAGVATQ